MFIRSLRLMFNGTPATGGTPPNPDPNAGTPPTPAPAPESGTPAAPAEPAEPSEADFPAGTPWREMNAEHQAAYWRFHSRQHEAKAKQHERDLTAERDKTKTDADREADRLRGEGASTATSKLLTTAVSGELRALTGKTKEQIATALSFVDVQKLTTDGELDDTKVAAFAAQLGVEEAPVPPQSQQRQFHQATRTPGGQQDRSGGSINAARAEIAAKMRGGK